MANRSESTAEPLRYQQVSNAARTMLGVEGESGRFEFKQDAAAVQPDVLVAAANWVAVAPDRRDGVTLLVGVGERQDPATGLVTGEVLGVKNLDKARHSIQSRCSEIRPVPVGLTIIEEGVATDKPFLRLEIRPTFPPHYDGKGRRVTRDGAATRPLTDEELLDIYLDREAGKFEQRFRQTAAKVLTRLDQLAAGVEEVTEELGSASSAAWTAASNADDSTSVARRLEDSIEALFDFAEDQALLTLPQLYFRLVEKRQAVWRAFATDAASRPTKTSEGLIERLRKQLEPAINSNDWAMNLLELQFWDEVLERRGDRESMTGWGREIATREELKIDTAVSLEDEIAELRQAIERARKAKRGKP